MSKQDSPALCLVSHTPILFIQGRDSILSSLLDYNIACKDPGALFEYLAPDTSKHHTRARLLAYAPPDRCVLVSVGMESTHIVQMKAVVHISQVSKLGDGKTGTPYHSPHLPRSLLTASSALKAETTLGIARRLRGAFTPLLLGWPESASRALCQLQSPVKLISWSPVAKEKVKTRGGLAECYDDG